MLKVTLFALLVIGCNGADHIEYDVQYGDDYRFYLGKEWFPTFPPEERDWNADFTVIRKDSNALLFYPSDVEYVSDYNDGDGNLRLSSFLFSFPDRSCSYYRIFFQFDTDYKTYEVVSRVFTPPTKHFESPVKVAEDSSSLPTEKNSTNVFRLQDEAKADARETAISADTLNTAAIITLLSQPSRTTRNVSFGIEWIANVFQIRHPGLSYKDEFKNTYTGPPVLVTAHVIERLKEVRDKMKVTKRPKK